MCHFLNSEVITNRMKEVQLGLKENWKQFTILVIINAFVGGMVGLERSILPRIAEVEFHIAAKTAVLSFIIVFGIVKAITNYFTGALANKIGRKNFTNNRVAFCYSGSFHLNVSKQLELDSISECITWYQPGSNMEQYGSNENRFGR
jgi:hypothetical protein